MKGTNFPGLTLFTPANLRRAASLSLTGFAMIVMLAFSAQKAYAHHPIVSAASAVCNADGTVTISYTVDSWDPGSVFGNQTPPINGAAGPGDGDNMSINVLFDGNIANTGSFLANTSPPDEFKGSAPVTESGVTTVHVSAVATNNSPWGDGLFDYHTSDDFNASQDVPLPTCGSPSGNGRFTGGGKVVVSNAIVPASGDVTLTKGFQVECDLDPQHETLELNWGAATHFHMDTITRAFCSKPGIPNPPTADVNRIDGGGTGKYNNMPGYTVDFTLIDNGEPGTSDAAGFIVCLTDPADPTHCTNPATQVLNVPLQTVSTGNIQAHLDQGH